jgi:tetratricopeptide repeat protein 8
LLFSAGVLEMRKGHTEQARAFFQTAASLGPAMFEANYNYARFSKQLVRQITSI